MPVANAAVTAKPTKVGTTPEFPYTGTTPAQPTKVGTTGSSSKGKITAEPIKGIIQAAESSRNRIGDQPSKPTISFESSKIKIDDLSEESEELILTPENLTELTEWLDQIKFTRKKRNSRNLSAYFSDGVMVAEIFAHFDPRSVDLHNYPPANNSNKKKSNWQHLRRNPFAKLGIKIPEAKIPELALGSAGVIEPILWKVKNKIKKSEETAKGRLSTASLGSHQLSAIAEGINDRMRPSTAFVQDKTWATSPPEHDVSDQSKFRIRMLKKFGQHKDSKLGGKPVECSYDSYSPHRCSTAHTFELPPFTFSTDCCGCYHGYDNSCCEDY